MRHALIVDDQEANRCLLRALLEGHGFTVDEARHGAEALALARKRPPDLIISDLLMPVLDGYSLLRHLRADERLKGIPFVVYTATYTEPKDERLALALGADAFILKPAEPEPFMARIQEVMGQRDRGELPSGSESGGQGEDAGLFKAHNEVLVRKLEHKAQQLEQTNRILLEENAERQRTETALRGSEERYRALFDAIADPLFVYDSETLAYLAVNDAAVARYGYSREELLRMTIKDLRPADDVPALLEVVARAGMGRESRGVWRHRTKDGTIIDADITAQGLDFAGRAVFVVQARDVTEVRRAEGKIAQANRLLRALIDGTTDMVFVKDLSGRYLLCNEAAAAFVGRTVEDVIGEDDTAIFSGDDARAVMASDRLVMESNQVHVGEDVLRAAGKPRTFHSFKAPYRDEQGHVIGVLGIARDITDRKRLEAQLQQAQKMEAIGRLAGGVAHDFNNLLTIISGYSELLLTLPELNDEGRESAEAINQASLRAAALTRQLLGFSRRTMLQPRVIDLNGVVTESGKMLRRLIGEDILFSTVLNPDISRVKVDPGLLDQVLMNLALNARDAMPTGGKITIETANVDLGDDYVASHPDARRGPHVALSMTDTGTGMTPEVLDHIFEPFFTTKDDAGTGLGLAMVFGIVQQSGGWVDVSSEPGHATMFTIYLPAVTEDVVKERASPPAREVRGTETILLVEDDVGVRRLALMSLQRHGYTVLTATDGGDALKTAVDHAGSIDLLLTDVVMPNVSGPELAERMRTRFPHMQILFMSGYTDDAVIRHGLLEAGVSFLQKPFTPHALALKVRQVLEENKAAGG